MANPSLLLLLSVSIIHYSISTPILPNTSEDLIIDAYASYRTDVVETNTHVLLQRSPGSIPSSEELPPWNPVAGFSDLIIGLKADIAAQISVSGPTSPVGVNWYFNNNARPSDQVWQWRMNVSSQGKPKPNWQDVKSAVAVLERKIGRFQRGRREQEELRTVEVVLGRLGEEGNESEEGRLGTAWVWWGHMYDLKGDGAVLLGTDVDIKATAIE